MYIRSLLKIRNYLKDITPYTMQTEKPVEGAQGATTTATAPEVKAENKDRAKKPIETSAIVNPSKRAKREAAKAALALKQKAEADAKAKTDAANAAATVKKLTEKKDLKYKYPVEIDNLADRKKFRAEVRRTIESIENSLTKLKKSNLPEDLKLMGKKELELTKYKKSVLAHPVGA